MTWLSSSRPTGSHLSCGGEVGSDSIVMASKSYWRIKRVKGLHLAAEKGYVDLTYIDIRQCPTSLILLSSTDASLPSIQVPRGCLPCSHPPRPSRLFEVLSGPWLEYLLITFADEGTSWDGPTLFQRGWRSHGESSSRTCGTMAKVLTHGERYKDSPLCLKLAEQEHWVRQHGPRCDQPA